MTTLNRNVIRNNQLKARLQAFFDANKSDLARFGSTVNQTLEAFVIAQVAAWFKNRPGWIVEVVNPPIMTENRRSD